MNTFIISNTRIATPFEIIENGFVYIRKGVIETIEQTSPYKVHRSCSIVDGRGCWLFPGIIDIYNKELLDDRSSDFFNIENRLRNHGITSVYHYIPDELSYDPNDFYTQKKMGTIRHNIQHNIKINSRYTVVSADSIIREALNPENISIYDIIDNPREYIISTDQAYSSIIESIFILYDKYKANLADAVGMATINPATALGIEKKFGSIECGKTGDLVLVRNSNGIAVIEKVYVSGCRIY